MKLNLKIYILRNIFILFFLLTFQFWENAAAQGSAFWPEPKQIPGYDPSTDPPILVTDNSGIVYAFSSQPVSNPEGSGKTAIFYNQWSIERGWTESYDIILAPYKSNIFISDASTDDLGMMNVIFVSGDNTSANLYYTKAPISKSQKSSSWSKPILIANFINISSKAGLEIDDSGNMIVLFSGYQSGQGIYFTQSGDRGENWSSPKPVFLTNSDKLIPISLQIYGGKENKELAIWNVVDKAGQGRAVYFSKYLKDENIWNTPQKIADSPSGYGTNSPTIIEHDGKIFALFILTPQIIMRISTNQGKSWESPVILFTRHIGVNGSLSLLEDSNDNLHLFFGQRITGNPDIHGMWHSDWSDDHWTEPGAVVSGPRIMDGEKSFDPFDAKGIVSQGNVILLTWRTDPGNGPENENGVWYSYLQLNGPIINPKATLVVTPTMSKPSPTVIPEVIGTQEIIAIPKSEKNNTTNDVFSPLLLGTIPVVVLFISARFIMKKKHH